MQFNTLRLITLLVMVLIGNLLPAQSYFQTINYQTLVNTPISENATGSIPPGFIIGTIQETQVPANGTLSFDSDPALFDTVTYTPDFNFVGIDSAVLSCLLFDSSTIEILLIYEVLLNAPLNAVDDFADATTNTSLNVSVLENDLYFGQPTINLVLSPAQGSAVVNASSYPSITYVPNSTYIGLDSLAYELVDGAGSRDTAWVFLDVQDPFTSFPFPTTLTEENVPVTISILDLWLLGVGNFNIIQAPSNGTASFNANMDSVTYTPNSGFIGRDTIIVEITGSSYFVGLEVIVVPAGQLIALSDDHVTLYPDSSIQFNPLANDQGNLTITNVTSPQNGQITWTNNSVTYTPNPGFIGVELVQYTACNTAGVCDVADIELNVSASGSGLGLLLYEATTAENTPLLISMSDSSATGVTFTVTTQPTNGFVDYFPGDTTLFDSLGNAYTVYDLLVYTPNTNYLGMDTAVIEVGIPGIPGPLLEFLLVVEVQDSSTFGFRLMNLYAMDPQTGTMTPMTGITSIEQDLRIEGVSFGPNPSNGAEANLSWEADNSSYALSVRDMRGRVIWKEEDIRNGASDLSRSNVQTGIYIIELRSGEKRWVQKWIVR